MTTRQEIIGRLEAIEGKADSMMERNDRLMGETAVLRSQLADALRQVEEQKQEIDRLRNAAADIPLLKAFADYVDERVKMFAEPAHAHSMMEEAVSGDLTVIKSVPDIELKTMRPKLSLDESTLEGKILVMALSGRLPGTFGWGDIKKALEMEYAYKFGGGAQANKVKAALDSLIGTYRALDRRVENNQFVYSLKADAKDRVKES